MVSLFWSVPLILISVLGLAVNGYILVVILVARQVSNANNILLLHLVTINISLGIMFLIFATPGIKGLDWTSTGVPCVLHGFFFTLFHPLILWTICALNCDRYYVIAAPLHYTHIVSSKKVLAGLAAGWTISLLLCIPPFFSVAPYSYIPGLGACAPDFALGYRPVWYAAAFTAFTLLLPVTVIVCCNLKILMIARYHRHRIASAIFEVTLSAQVTITHQRNPFFSPVLSVPPRDGPPRPPPPIFRGKSAIYSVVQIVGSFMFLYIPYYVLILSEAALNSLDERGSNEKFENARINQHFYTLASSLLVCTLPVNGFLYGLKNKTLRKTFQNYWRKKLTKSEVNQEIQARTPSTCGSRRPSLTPLGFLSKPTLQRRLSETLFDVNKSLRTSSRNKIMRIASELAWRPASSGSLNTSPKEELPNKAIKQTTSCNTLQVPDAEGCAITEDELFMRLQNSKQGLDSPSKPQSSTGLLLQKFFRFEQEKLSRKANITVQNVLEPLPKRSPRILITRAFSEESDKTSAANSPAKQISKKQSHSTTTLLEKKWRQIRYKDEEDTDSDGNKSRETIKPLLGSSSLSYRSSEESSDASETSSGRICMNIDNRSLSAENSSETDNPTEDHILLTWNGHKKYHKAEDARKSRPLLRQALVHNQEIIL